MTDKITIIDDEPKPEPKIVVVEPRPKVEVVTEKTTVIETKKE